MCEPISIALAAGAAAVGAYGQIQAGKSAKAQADYQSQVARNNAQIAEQQAVNAEKRGDIDAGEQRRQTLLELGAVRADFASRGIDPDSATAADVQGAVAETGELDALTVQNNTANEAFGFRSQRQNFETDAILSTAQGKAAQRSSRFQAGATILGGASKTAGRVGRFRAANARATSGVA